MVGVKKFSAIAAVSAVAVTGAAASLQPADVSHAHHLLSHRSLAERQLHNQQPPSMVKVQKRLFSAIGDGLGGIINGLGKDLGLNELDEADYHLHNLRRGIVGDLLGAGGQDGQPPSSSSSNSPAPATSQAPSNNNGGGSSSNAPAPAPAPSTSASANNNPTTQQPANNNNGNTSANNNNQNRPTTSAPSTTNNNNNGSNRAPANNNNNSNSNNNSNNNNNNNNNSQANRGSAQPQAAAAASAAPTGINSIAAAASASASAAAASLLSAASASQASAEGLASAAAATFARSTGTASGAAATGGANRANSSGSSSGSDGTTKVVVPIVVIAVSVAVIAVAWTLIRRYRKRKAEHYDPRMQPIENSYHYRSTIGPPLAAGGAAFAVGGAAAGLVRDRPRRDSYESYRAGRPMSSLTEEEGDFSGAAPPMQEVAPYAAVGSASGRIRNYGSNRGGGGNADQDLPPAHRVTDSMYIDDATAARYPSGGEVTPFSDEHGAYDVNYYDGSSSAGYNNRATRGMDAAGVNNGAGRPYSPYAEVHRGSPADEADYYDYDRASSSRRGAADPFADTKRWSG